MPEGPGSIWFHAVWPDAMEKPPAAPFPAVQRCPKPVPCPVVPQSAEMLGLAPSAPILLGWPQWCWLAPRAQTLPVPREYRANPRAKVLVSGRTLPPALVGDLPLQEPLRWQRLTPEHQDPCLQVKASPAGATWAILKAAGQAGLFCLPLGRRCPPIVQGPWHGQPRWGRPAIQSCPAHQCWQAAEGAPQDPPAALPVRPQAGGSVRPPQNKAASKLQAPPVQPARLSGSKMPD